MSFARRGLSLVEMLIVVTLIATMMALSLPMLSNANAKARAELCRQNMYEIGQTVSSFTQDMGCLPTLHGLEPPQAGLSLPEFVEPRLNSHYVVFCPSDETDQSIVLGTSYRWNSTFNGKRPGEFDSLLGMPMLADREAFHAGPDLPTNELALVEDDAGYRLSQIGDDQRDEQGKRKGLYLSKKPPKQPNHNNPHGNHPGQGNAYGRPDDHHGHH